MVSLLTLTCWLQALANHARCAGPSNGAPAYPDFLSAGPGLMAVVLVLINSYPDLLSAGPGLTAVALVLINSAAVTFTFCLQALADSYQTTPDALALAVVLVQPFHPMVLSGAACVSHLR